MKIICLLLILLSHNIHAAEIANSGGDSANSANSSGPFSSYLVCANGLDYPIAQSMNINASDPQEVPDSQNPSLFVGTNGGQSGFFVLTPQGVTFDSVPIFKPKNAMPGYDLSVKRTDGRTRFFHWYLNEQGESDTVSYGEEFFQKGNAGVVFHELGATHQYLPSAAANEGIERETVKRLKTMPLAKAAGAEQEKWEKRKYGKGRNPWSDEIAKGALCSCMKTGNKKIIEASKTVAQDLKIDGIDNCLGLPPTVWLEKFWRQFGNEAMAATANRSLVSLKTMSPPRLVHLTDEKAEYCVSDKVFGVALQSGRISESKAKCPHGAIGALMTSKKVRAKVVKTQVLFEAL